MKVLNLQAGEGLGPCGNNKYLITLFFCFSKEHRAKKEGVCVCVRLIYFLSCLCICITKKIT